MTTPRDLPWLTGAPLSADDGGVGRGLPVGLSACRPACIPTGLPAYDSSISITQLNFDIYFFNKFVLSVYSYERRRTRVQSGAMK